MKFYVNANYGASGSSGKDKDACLWLPGYHMCEATILNVTYIFAKLDTTGEKDVRRGEAGLGIFVHFSTQP